MASTTPTAYENFLLLSVQLCGISSFDLVGTGYASQYYDTVAGIVGPDRLQRLLDSFAGLTRDPEARNYALRKAILENEEFGPVARNIIKLWYSAVWFALPDEWQTKYGHIEKNVEFIPFAYAYPESLLGPATGAHPAGAKPTGHQSWALPPVYLSIPPECV